MDETAKIETAKTETDAILTTKKRKKKQTNKLITEKKQKQIPTVVATVNDEEPKPKPKRGRKKKVVVPIKVTTEKVDEIFITDEQPVYCRAPIEFGGMTVFTKIEHPPSPPPPPPSRLNKNYPETKKKNNKRKTITTLKDENRWKTKVEKNNLKVLNTKIENGKVVCWYCTHTFEGNAVSCPVSFSISRGYLCHGVFCGWGCAKTWNMESGSQMKFQRNDFINKLIRLSNNGSYVRIQPAPNRYVLVKFGGHLEIDKFREISFPVNEFHDLFQQNGTNEKINFTLKTPCSEIEF